MFTSLSKKMSQSIRNIMYSKRVTKYDVSKYLDIVQRSLLESDVALSVVQSFVELVKDNIIKINIDSCCISGPEFIKILRHALIKAMKCEVNGQDLNLNDRSLTKLLIVGAQGSGKTTTTGKLARFLKVRKNKKVLVVSTDVYRSAAINQLKVFASSEKIDCFEDYTSNIGPVQIVQKAIDYAKLNFYNVIVVDTAGCLKTDCNAFLELVDIYKVINPEEVLFVVDSMIGQGSIDIINMFDKNLSLTGIVVTKLDGNACGGIALSAKFLTGKPIKFIGTGESIDTLEVFYPDRIVNRIFGMGDILTLMEDIECQNKFNEKKKYVNYNNNSVNDFNLIDFLEYIKQIQKLGGLNSILSKLPSVGLELSSVQSSLKNYDFVKMESIINSMTIKERVNPDIINESRIKRIAVGSGVNISDVVNLIDKFYTIRNIIKKINKNGIFKIMNMFTGKMKFGNLIK
ncbi:4.5S-RNP protein, GTP binding export factor, part of signal recognition particle with 4.5 RNA [Candidatus Blochmanniella floridana]|uniref:signal-recognition-particle GTPase n=1 Tax=Blochmanniella floridana TaxID=203907 RepID=Q7VQG1_BLOFL|nr:4.5S-RNP protein, GTP binding export factor, part of signal recognition particle with 4.5 RNA [Candidatus Blochmannia floridanus]